MKRLIKAVVTAVLCAAVLSGCGMIEKDSKAENNSLSESLGKAASEIPPAQSEMPATAPVSVPSATPVSVPVLEGPISIDESYFSVLGATYEELSEAYGDVNIYAHQEGGPFANFGAIGAYCGFDAMMFEEYYDSYDSWLFDKNEFSYDDLYYIGERYAPSDFVVNYVKFYDYGANAFLGSDEPVMLSTVNEHFGREEEALTPDEVYGIYETSAYEYGEYILRFEVTPVDEDYVVDCVNIRKKTNEQLPANNPPSAEKTEQEQLAKDIFFEEIVGTWVSPVGEFSENAFIVMGINDDLTFKCAHRFEDSIGTALFTGIIRHAWNYNDSVNDFPDMINFELISSDAPDAIGGNFLMSMTLVNGVWQLNLEKTSGGRTILDVDMKNSHVLYREGKEKSSSSGMKKDETFTAKLWEQDGESGFVWLEYGDYYDSTGRFVSDNHKAVRYKICPDPDMGSLDMLYEGNVYIFATASNGEIIIINRAWQDMGEELNSDDIMELACEILEKKMPRYRECLAKGMKALFTGETTVIDGKTCYDVSVGTDHPEHFVREVHYSVNLDSEKIYEFDFVNALWLLAE